MSFRKESSLKTVEYVSEKDSSKTILLNGRYFAPINLTFVESKVIENLKPGIYNVKIGGGGYASQRQLLFKALYSTIVNKAVKQDLKKRSPMIDRTDTRKTYPKKYGGPKARARYQKSYR